MKNKEDKIINFYLEGNSYETTGKLFNCSATKIRKILIENKIKLRQTTCLKKCNENYFENIDTPNKAYFLGFIYADGCIVDAKGRQNQLVIHIHEQDKSILESFSKELEFSGKLQFYKGSKIHSTKNYKYKRNNAYRLTISSDKLCQDLNNLGVTPRKTHTLTFPKLNQVPENLMNHFIRGLMDGDGYISVRKGKKDESNCLFTFGIVGTYDICAGVQKWLSNKLILNPNKKLRKCKCIFGMSYSHNKDIVKIYNYLYPQKENTELFLIRKHNKFKQIFNYSFNQASSKLSYEDQILLKNLISPIPISDNI